MDASTPTIDKTKDDIYKTFQQSKKDSVSIAVDYDMR